MRGEDSLSLSVLEYSLLTYKLVLTNSFIFVTQNFNKILIISKMIDHSYSLGLFTSKVRGHG